MAADTNNLPPNVEVADTKWTTGNGLSWERRKELGLTELYSLKFYDVKGLGWVLCTLHIGSGGKRAGNSSERTYGIGVADEKIYTVGRGPHGLREVEVHLTADNIERLMPYVELWRKGMEEANTIRDRISSRRARGVLRRAGLDAPWYS